MSQDQHPDTHPAVTPAIRTILTQTEQYVRAAMPRFTKELRTICDIASSSDNTIGLNTMADYLEKRLTALGFTTDIITHERGNAVIGVLAGSNPAARPLLLLAHHDTVYGENVTAPPSTIIGNHFFGPGVADMKGGVLQALYTLEALRKHHHTNFSHILFLSVPDEEIDNRYHTGLLETLCHTYHPFVFTLESARTLGNVVVQRKGVQRYTITAKGVAAHAGAEFHSGKSAVLELAHQMVQFCSLPNLPDGVTVNIGPFRGGTMPNIVADYAEATIEVRFLAKEHLAYVVNRWEACLGKQLVEGVDLSMVPVSGGIPPMELSAYSQIVADNFGKIAAFLGHEYYAEVRGGSSDGGNANAHGTDALDGFGAVGHQGHSPDEYIDLAAVPHKAAILAATIMSIADLPLTHSAGMPVKHTAAHKGKDITVAILT
ncbi:MAG TPA: M20/M25/M40 family metallo-hydrolase [Candidatus Saccharimonadales bacterium]|nr:M20/M25/M40 family metallo-hydrolase [Candidatus Saccharimonadales bacterium]